MDKNTLKLVKILSKSILSRDVVQSVLEEEIQKINSSIIYLDFSEIEFISRSAAHELLKMKEKFEYDFNKKEIIFKDPSLNVAEMIRTIAANKAYSQNKEEDFAPKRISIEDLINA